jgi:alginate O-acetyltransferase complex protein AlgI
VLFFTCKSVLGRKWILLFASLIFYSFWDIRSLPILLASISFNWLLGNLILSFKSVVILRVGIITNLVFLASTKYFTLLFEPIIFLFESNTNATLNNSIWFPVGVSFFTFTQIGFLVDTHQRKTLPTSFLDYLNFVTFFPHLIAGPVLNFSHFIPQLQKLGQNLDKSHKKFLWVGFTLFSTGMAKKVLVADRLAPFVNNYFDQDPNSSTQVLALAAILGFTFQLYFDFSGYSEMASGLALMMGLRIPVNFSTPYKSKSIIDFWRRWHISLSNFLRDYLYIPLGGSRGTKFLRYRNLMITMTLGGLWHGSNWTFVIWGFAHGILLVLNHLLREFPVNNYGIVKRNSLSCFFLRFMKCLFTFTLVALLWVLFRSENIEVAFSIYKNLFSSNFGNFNDVLGVYFMLLLASIWLVLERPNMNPDDKFVSNISKSFTVILFTFTSLLLSFPTAYLYAQF